MDFSAPMNPRSEIASMRYYNLVDSNRSFKHACSEELIIKREWHIDIKIAIGVLEEMKVQDLNIWNVSSPFRWQREEWIPLPSHQ